jgi:hypothetical protein
MNDSPRIMVGSSELLLELAHHSQRGGGAKASRLALAKSMSLLRSLLVRWLVSMMQPMPSLLSKNRAVAPVAKDGGAGEIMFGFRGLYHES